MKTIKNKFSEAEIIEQNICRLRNELEELCVKYPSQRIKVETGKDSLKNEDVDQWLIDIPNLSNDIFNGYMRPIAVIQSELAEQQRKLKEIALLATEDFRLKLNRFSELYDSNGIFGSPNFNLSDLKHLPESSSDDGLTKSTDNRLPYNCKLETVRAYFEKLCTVDFNGKQILTSEDIDYLLAAEFIGFPKTTENRILHPKCKKIVLKYFINQFVTQFCSRSHYPMYRNMLIRRFDRFTKDKSKSVLSNFAKRPVHYPKYLE